jgi:hypothetical protein
MNFSRLILIGIFLVIAPVINSANKKSKIDKETQAALAAFKRLSLIATGSTPVKNTAPKVPTSTKPLAPGAPQQTPAQPPQEKYIEMHLDPFKL